MLARLRPGFRALDEAVESVVRTCQPVLTITAAPAFASRVARAAPVAVQRRSPEHRNPRGRDHQGRRSTRSPADVAVRMGRGGWPDVHAEKLAPTTCFRSAHQPSAIVFAVPRTWPACPSSTTRVPSFHGPTGSGVPGIARVPRLAGPTFSDPVLALEAALAGQGVVLAWEMIVADAIADGRLIRPFPTISKTPVSYWLLATPAKLRLRTVREPSDPGSSRRWTGHCARAPDRAAQRSRAVGHDVSRCGRSQGRTAGDAPAGSRTAPVPSRSTRHALCLQCDADPMVRRDTSGRAAMGVAHPQGAQRRQGPRRRHLQMVRERRQQRLRAHHAPVCRGRTDLVIGEIFGVERAARRVAASYPKVAFLMGSSFGRPSRTWRSSTTSSTSRPISPAWWPGRRRSRTSIGMVGGYAIPEVNRLMNAFMDGARARSTRTSSSW